VSRRPVMKQVECTKEWLIHENGHIYKKKRVGIWEVDDSGDAKEISYYFKKELVL